MSSYKRVGYVRRFFVAASLLAVALLTGAEERRSLPGAERGAPFEGVKPQKRVIRPEFAGEVAPLLVTLPRIDGTPELLAEVVLGEKTLVRQTIELEGNVPEQSVVRLLGSHGTELGKLRRIAAVRADELLVRVLAGERVVTGGRFADFDAASPGLVGNANVVGATRVIEVSLGVKRNSASIGTNGYQPDPECDAQCMAEYDFCMQYICDQRGSCQSCIDQYHNCSVACPRVCVDPKDVDDFTRYVYLGSDYYGITCMRDSRDNQLYSWDVYKDNFRVENVRRTEYCNGTSSEQVMSTSNTYRWCFYKRYFSSCSISSGTLYPSQICG